MVIAKMIFDKLNWTPYRNNEKAMILPKKLTLHSGTMVYERPSNDRTFVLSHEGDTVEVVGEINGFYLIKGTVGDLIRGGKVFDKNPGAILISEIQNGGYCVGYIPSFVALSERRWSYARSHAIESFEVV